jgi:hypothetical protein
MEIAKTSALRPARIIVWLLIIGASCLDPFPPPRGAANLNLLVVDGFLNSASGLAQVRLTRTLPLDATDAYPVESGALVEVEDEHGATFTVPEESPGLYSLITNNLHVGDRYRLIIHTTDGDRYESEQVQLKQSPVLESVHWVQEGNGITIKVDSRDESGNTRYYQWFYTETWEYDADKNSSFVIKGGRPVNRTAEEGIHICYSTTRSSKIFISTTADQSGDVINDFPLVHIEGGSKKLCRIYSILVQQRALDEAGYNYWLQLEKTTENLGSLFDPLPSQVTGNMHASKPGEVVLGFFSGSAVEEKRIYIRHWDLPLELQFTTRRRCSVDTVAHIESYPDGTPFLNEVSMSFPWIKSDPVYICMDCRLEGGTVTKPSFWPQ